VSNFGDMDVETIAFRWMPFMHSRAGLAICPEYSKLHQIGASAIRNQPDAQQRLYRAGLCLLAAGDSKPRVKDSSAAADLDAERSVCIPCLSASTALATAAAPARSRLQAQSSKATSSWKGAFPRYCNGCHGVRGDGKGTLAPYLDPKPRDYTMGIFKCRSTPTGTLPTDEDLYNTMTRGFVTAAMPPWAPLPPQTRMDIVAYLKGFSPRFAKEAPGVPIPIPAETAVTLESIRRGAELYKSSNAHGAMEPKAMATGRMPRRWSISSTNRSPLTTSPSPTDSSAASQTAIFTAPS
jgi:cytochrome c553